MWNRECGGTAPQLFLCGLSCHPSRAGSAPPCRGKQVGCRQRLGFATSLRAALLRPKRPTGLILRPVYQAGSMSGAGKERVRAAHGCGCCVHGMRTPCTPVGGRAQCTHAVLPQGRQLTAVHLPGPCWGSYAAGTPRGYDGASAGQQEASGNGNSNSPATPIPPPRYLGQG